MRARPLWFIAGAVAGVYASVKAKRAAYRLSVPGLVDQAGAAGAGWRAFSEEVRDGMHARESQIAAELHIEREPSSFMLESQKDHH